MSSCAAICSLLLELQIERQKSVSQSGVLQIFCFGHGGVIKLVLSWFSGYVPLRYATSCDCDSWKRLEAQKAHCS